MGLFQVGEQWLARIAAKRLMYILAKGAVALLTYQKAAVIQGQLGIQVDPQKFEAGAAAMMLGGLELLHDYLKVKFPSLSKWI